MGAEIGQPLTPLQILAVYDPLASSQTLGMRLGQGWDSSPGASFQYNHNYTERKVEQGIVSFSSKLKPCSLLYLIQIKILSAHLLRKDPSVYLKEAYLEFSPILMGKVGRLRLDITSNMHPKVRESTVDELKQL